MHHAINACKRRAPTLVAMRIELLLGQNIAAGLVDEREKKKEISPCRANRSKKTQLHIPTHLA